MSTTKAPSSSKKHLLFWGGLILGLLLGSPLVSGQAISSASSSASASSSSGTGIQGAFPGLPAIGINWPYGDCPLVVAQADFNGNDYTYSSAPDVASCCAKCAANVQDYLQSKGANADPEGKACLAWTYNPNSKLCYLKNSTKKGSKTSLTATPGVYTGSYEGKFPALRSEYNTFVASKLQAVQTISSVSSVATAVDGQNSQVSTTCAESSCQKIAATIK